jgi:hypothetical protein
VTSAQLDDQTATLSAFLCSAWMRSGLVYRERAECVQWDVCDRATRLFAMRNGEHFPTLRIWLEVRRERPRKEAS